MTDPQKSPPDDKSLTLWQVIQSVAAAFFGVQSSANRVRDFTYGKPHQFIIIGFIMTVVFVATLVLVVKLVLYLAGV